jgi:protoheme IX farnesyltransferase
MPHVLGLSTYRRQEYAAAGIRVMPLVHGVPATRRHAIAWAASLLPIGALPFVLGLSGWVYLAVAGVLGVTFLAITACPIGSEADAADRWGRRTFLASLLYVPVLFTALMLDVSG